MAYTKETWQRLFQSKFNLSKWQVVLQDYFKANKLRLQPEALDEEAEERRGYFLGETMTKDGYNLGFFYYEMEDGSVLRRKVGLRNLVRPYLTYGLDAALAVFNDGTNWRLSLICDLKGGVEATSAKRFTYVFGDGKAFYKTPVQRFTDLQKNADEYLKIKEAFSVEALSDDFFDEYRKQYAEFVKFLTGKEYVKKGNKWVEEVKDEPDAQFFTSFGEDEKLVRDYIKKMLGRIVFLYFLQSKGWLAGNLHYMHDLFYDSADAIKADFLDKVLEPMFFGLLNTKLEDRSTAPLVNGVGVKYIPDAEQIPYLNGGLFQQEKIDEVDSRFPADMFKKLFDFFDSYNFTIDENDPNDAEVGVDPEMLGKIFENLLEDNKDKGAFYTPKEIVRYMCQESLTAYLQTGIENEETKTHIANFVKTYEVEELGGASSELAQSIDQKLKDVKICDPAIGSGAFPMGLLRELYGCRKAIEVFEADNAADIKRHIIQNNIYGVDIEKGAVDIARLRFWLALIIDEKEPMPLPNLDFKIMQGNSLLESFMGVDLNVTSKKVKTGRDTKKTRGVLSLGFEEVDIQKTIQDLVKSYFSITDHTLRAQRRKEIDKYVKDYIKICAEGNHAVLAAVDELEIPNDQFFLWHTYFNDVFEKGGFDIVIGNPPYISAVNMARTDTEKREYKRLYPEAVGAYDMYVLFLLLAIKLASKVYSFIIPNKLLIADYAKNTRSKIWENGWEYSVDVSIFNVFKNAGVYPIIILGNKGGNAGYRQYLLSAYDDLLLRNFIVNTELQTETTISDCGLKVCSGATGFQAQIIKKYIVSQSTNTSIPFTVSGNIDRYSFTNERVRYMGNRYDEAFIEFNTEIAESKWKMWRNPKIIIAGMTKCIEATFVDTSLALGVGVYAITNFASFNPYYVLGLLNSKYTTYYLRKKFKDKHLAGGYLAINKSTIEQLPMVKSEHQEDIAHLAKDVLEKKNIGVDTTSLENEIDFLVYHLYGLTYDEVLIVDPETPITREEYEAYKGE